MADGAFNPSRCEIKTARIIPHTERGGEGYDVSLMIGDFRMSQDMNLVAINGSFDVLDNIGLLQNVPFRGEEELELVFYCFDLQTEVSLYCQIYQIDNVEMATNTKGVSYRMHWITKPSYEASKRSLIKSYTYAKPGSIVKDIFNKCFGGVTKTESLPNKEKIPEHTSVYKLKTDPGRYLFIEDSDNTITCTIPDYMPTQALNFIASKCFGSTRSKSSLFRFFETYRGYYFVSDEWLYANGRENGAKDFHFNPDVVLDGKLPQEQTEGLTGLHYNNRVNTAGELINGAYSNTVFEIDILKRTAKRYNYKYTDYVSDYTDIAAKKATLDIDVHSKEFITDTFTHENAKQFMIIRDYSEKFIGPIAYRPEANYREIAAKRNMFHQHAMATQVVAVTAGRLDMMAGQIINLNVKEMNAGGQFEKNKQLSGRYLVSSVDHQVSDGELGTGMILHKYGFSDAGDDINGVDNE